MAANVDNDRHSIVEAVVALLLGVTTLASAWCAYEATLWNGEQIRHLSQASDNQFEAVRRTSPGVRAQLIDVTTVVSYVQARTRGDTTTAAFFVDHARGEFRPVLTSWIADDTGAAPAGTPFERAEYRVTEDVAAVKLQGDGKRHLQIANQANGYGDLYVVHTVFLTLALFFFGAAAQLRRQTVRLGMLIFGAAVLAASLVSMIRLPHLGVQTPRATAATATQ